MKKFRLGVSNIYIPLDSHHYDSKSAQEHRGAYLMYKIYLFIGSSETRNSTEGVNSNLDSLTRVTKIPVRKSKIPKRETLEGRLQSTCTLHRLVKLKRNLVQRRPTSRLPRGRRR